MTDETTEAPEDNPSFGYGDCETLDAIADFLSGREWDADTLVAIADAVRETGREVRDVEA